MIRVRFGSTLLSCFLGVCLLAGCAKDKLEDLSSEEVTLTDASSAIRLFNFVNTGVDLAVNNIPLTNYSTGQATTLGLKLFPSGVWTNSDGGSPFSIPTSLVDKQNKVHLVMTPRGSTVAFNYPTIDTVLQNDPLNPKDYYVLADGSMKVINRNAAAPSQPDHFKIRVINLAADDDKTGLYGPVTLTFSNGQSVNIATSNVLPNTASDYIELPLGAYEFKLFINGDLTRQLAELPLKPDFNYLNQTAAGQPKLQEALFPKIRTFKAGGTYSIVITKALLTQLYKDCCNTWTWYQPANAYRIVTEQSPATPNVTYACMDAANALRSSRLSIAVDGQMLGRDIAFGKAADHGVYVYGMHHVTAMDQQGQIVAEKDIMMYPNDYLTAWVYLNPAGSPDIVFSSTDMTSTFYQSNVTSGALIVNDYGTDGTLRIKTSDYNWQARFLNLSEDVPYLTIGHDGFDLGPAQGAGYVMLFLDYYGTYSKIIDSTSFATATVNMARGFTAATQPYLMFQVNSNSFWRGDGTNNVKNVGSYITANTNTILPGKYLPGKNITAFQSSPGTPPVIPGALLLNVKGLSWSSFIANPSMYTDPKVTPFLEPGFYSVALVGKAADAVNGQPQLMYVKHNK